MSEGADLLQIGQSGAARGMPADILDPQHEIGQDFLRAKAGEPDEQGGQLGPRLGQKGYPLYGGSNSSLGGGGEAPIGHSGVAQIKEAPAPKTYGAGGRQSASAVPAIYAGNPDLTNGGR